MSRHHDNFLDQLPDGWSFDRLKDVASLRNEKATVASEQEDYLELEDLESGTGRILGRRNTLGVESAVTVFKKGDVLFGKLRPYLEKFYEAEFDGKCTGEILAFKPERIAGRFLLYCLASRWFIERCNALAYGAKMPRVSWPTQLSQFNVPFPPLPEQERIAAYLDASCAAIDAAVAAKRQQIEVLEALLKTILHTAVTRGLDGTVELRESGYKWLGQFPVKWGLRAIKRIVSTKITDGPHETPEFTGEGVQFISAEAIKNNQIDFDLRRGYISQALHEQYCRKCKPQKGDLFVVKSGATTGNVAYVSVDFEFSIWSPLALVRCDERIAFYKFIYYVLLTDVFRKQVELSWSFGTQQNIGMRVIERIKVPIPSVAEQREIAAFLDNETSKISEIRANIESQISTLLVYRKSLIHECVTGQRRITEEDLKKVKAHG